MWLKTPSSSWRQRWLNVKFIRRLKLHAEGVASAPEKYKRAFYPLLAEVKAIPQPS